MPTAVRCHWWQHGALCAACHRLWSLDHKRMPPAPLSPTLRNPAQPMHLRQGAEATRPTPNLAARPPCAPGCELRPWQLASSLRRAWPATLLCHSPLSCTEHAAPCRTPTPVVCRVCCTSRPSTAVRRAVNRRPRHQAHEATPRSSAPLQITLQPHGTTQPVRRAAPRIGRATGWCAPPRRGCLQQRVVAAQGADSLSAALWRRLHSSTFVTSMLAVDDTKGCRSPEMVVDL